MALPKVTEEDYVTYGGTHPWDVAKKSVPAAARAVRVYITKTTLDDEETEAYKNAICAAIDVDIAYGQSGGIGEGVSSLSIGSFSVSAGTNGESSYAASMRDAILGELYGTGLLYAGVALGSDVL